MNNQNDNSLLPPVEEKSLRIVFFVSASILFITTLWAVLDETFTRRPWKVYQADFYQMKIERLEAEFEKENADFEDKYGDEYTEVQDSLNAARARRNSPSYGQLKEQYNKINDEVKETTQNSRFEKSGLDELYYLLREAILHNEQDDIVSVEKEIESSEAIYKEINLLKDNYKKHLDDINHQLSVYDDGVKKWSDEVLKMEEKIKGVKRRIKLTKETPVAIFQTMLPEYQKNEFGIMIMRVERCETCHPAGTDPLFLDAPSPFKSHPEEILELHPIEKFGCTPCHGGDGVALTVDEGHGKDKYWEEPLEPKSFMDSRCNKCHFEEIYTDNAPIINKAKQIIVESGCHGCHEIQSFTDLPKTGPDLNHVTRKTNIGWIYKWIFNPKEYLPHSRMPWMRLNEDETKAVTAYLNNISNDSDFQYVDSNYRGGNVKRGERLIKSVGCQACHVIDGNEAVRESRGLSYDRAPQLDWVGSKVNPEWLYDWIKNPKHYWSESSMPNLRLLNREAKDIVSYLMSKKNPEIDYEEFGRQIGNLDDEELIAQGKALIILKGCHGCHEIEGMEDEGRVAVLLTTFGDKKVEELDFGYTKPDSSLVADGTHKVVPRTWLDWVTNKLKDPMTYQTALIKAQMPTYSFNDEDIHALTVFLHSMTDYHVGEDYRPMMTEQEKEIDDGLRAILRFQCMNCHLIEGRGGHIRVLYEEESLAPPNLIGEGEKVQPQWLFQFIKKPETLRPWLSIRMPTFNLTNKEVSSIGRYFAARSDASFPYTYYADLPEPSKEVARTGKIMFDEMQCLSCHVIKGDLSGYSPDEIAKLAPNLKLANERLRHEWISEWLKDPQIKLPGTRMPQFFYPDFRTDELMTDYEYFDYSVDKQAEAIASHVISLGKK